LALLDVAFPSRHVLGVPDIHEINFQTLLFEHLKHGHPIDASFATTSRTDPRLFGGLLLSLQGAFRGSRAGVY
jgi:hypothetical protein